MNIWCLLPILSIFSTNVGISSAINLFGALSNVFGVLVPILSFLDPAQASCELDKSKVYFLVWTKILLMVVMD
ncbi:hypothetical protein Avbf_17315 [Armadillidium vulgare]|nr:hypothetical protein Avbf_17315 [Armadillidium vulgare]